MASDLGLRVRSSPTSRPAWSLLSPSPELESRFTPRHTALEIPAWPGPLLWSLLSAKPTLKPDLAPCRIFLKPSLISRVSSVSFPADGEEVALRAPQPAWIHGLYQLSPRSRPGASPSPCFCPSHHYFWGPGPGRSLRAAYSSGTQDPPF